MVNYTISSCMMVKSLYSNFSEISGYFDELLGFWIFGYFCILYPHFYIFYMLGSFLFLNSKIIEEIYISISVYFNY